MNKALIQQALDASEKMRSGLIQMHKEAESYGEAWAAAYVNEYRDLLPGSAEEQFKLLNAMQRRLSDYADAVTEGYDAIQALRTELAKPEPTQARDVFEMSLAYEGHRISKQITGIEIRNTRGIEKLILDTLVEMSKSMVTEVNK